MCPFTTYVNKRNGPLDEYEFDNIGLFIQRLDKIMRRRLLQNILFIEYYQFCVTNTNFYVISVWLLKPISISSIISWSGFLLNMFPWSWNGECFAYLVFGNGSHTLAGTIEFVGQFYGEFSQKFTFKSKLEFLKLLLVPALEQLFFIGLFSIHVSWLMCMLRNANLHHHNTINFRSADWRMALFTAMFTAPPSLLVRWLDIFGEFVIVVEETLSTICHCPNISNNIIAGMN